PAARGDAARRVGAVADAVVVGVLVAVVAVLAGIEPSVAALDPVAIGAATVGAAPGVEIALLAGVDHAVAARFEAALVAAVAWLRVHIVALLSRRRAAVHLAIAARRFRAVEVARRRGGGRVALLAVIDHTVAAPSARDVSRIGVAAIDHLAGIGDAS